MFVCLFIHCNALLIRRPLHYIQLIALLLLSVMHKLLLEVKSCWVLTVHPKKYAHGSQSIVGFFLWFVTDRLYPYSPHYIDVVMSAMASQTTGVSIVYSFVQARIKEYIKAPRYWLLVRGIHWWPVNSPHIGSVNLKCFHLMTSSWFRWWAQWLYSLRYSQYYQSKTKHNKPCAYFMGHSLQTDKLNGSQLTVDHL